MKNHILAQFSYHTFIIVEKMWPGTFLSQQNTFSNIFSNTVTVFESELSRDVGRSCFHGNSTRGGSMISPTLGVANLSMGGGGGESATNTCNSAKSALELQHAKIFWHQCVTNIDRAILDLQAIPCCFVDKAKNQLSCEW